MEKIRIARTNMFKTDAMPDMDAVGSAIRALSTLNSGHGDRSLFKMLKAYKKHSDVLLRYCFALMELNAANADAMTTLTGGTPTRHKQRWTQEEDELLVSLAAEGNSAIVMATNLNRTPSSIASRLTFLVGKEKISREVVGIILGYLDGEPVEGYFDGKVWKRGTR